MEYEPDDWVVLKIKSENEIFYKVFAGWRGGYLDGDSWRMNSGIVAFEDQSPLYGFYGFSGSVYWCHKSNYGIRGMYNNDVLSRILQQGESIVSIMPSETDWSNVQWQQ